MENLAPAPAAPAPKCHSNPDQAIVLAKWLLPDLNPVEAQVEALNLAMP